MKKAIGHKLWAIPEGYIPAQSTGPEPQMTSHETACVLNTGKDDAHIQIMIYFTDKDPAGPYKITVPSQRTKHIRFNDLTDPQPVPKDTDYACVIESDVPVVVQHTASTAGKLKMHCLAPLLFLLINYCAI